MDTRQKLVLQKLVDDPGQENGEVQLPSYSAQGGPTTVRYRILGLTVLVYMVTYMDRVVISSAVPSIQKEFGFSLVTMGWILSSFQWGYALFQIPSGWLGDRAGPRRALASIVTLWSLFSSATTLSWNSGSMAAFQFLFGTCESGAFPVATSSLARWVLPSERGFAQGLTHAGSRLGGALTPVLAVLVITRFGWRAAFYCLGFVGFLWAAAWLWYYRDRPGEHKSVNAAELDLLQSAIGKAASIRQRSVPWRRILHSRQLWVLSLMYFCYGYILGVYLVWFPKYLNAHRGFNLTQMGLYSSLVLLAGTVGDLVGGTLSDFWAKTTGDLKTGRRMVGSSGFVLSAISIVPACLTANPFTCLWLFCIAIFGLELTVGVSWAVTLDIGGDMAGSVSSIMNTFGNAGAAVSAALSAYLVALEGWIVPFMVMAGLSLLGALLYQRIDASRPVEMA